MKANLALATIIASSAFVSSPSSRVAPLEMVVSKGHTASAQPQPAQPNKAAPGDTKTNRLHSRRVARTNAPRGKRVSHTVAQGQRIARKARNVKRHRARV